MKSAELSHPDLAPLRARIDDVDSKILALVGERVKLAIEVGEVKRRHDLPVFDPEREKRLIERLVARKEAPLDAELVRRLFERVIAESRRIEQAHVDAQRGQ